MRPPLSPLGILLANTLPAIVLIALYADMLGVVRPLLEEGSLRSWGRHGLALGIMALAATVYALMSWRWRRPVHPIYGIAVFLLYVPLLWSFMESFRELLPWSIPRWMVPEEAEIYALRLLCVPLAHALFVLVAASLPAGDRGKPLRDLLIGAAIPLAVYFFVQVAEPWRSGVDFEKHVWVVVFITLVVAFLFFLCRGVMALVRRARPGMSPLAVVLRVLIALVFPLLGLSIHNGLFSHWLELHGVFGDLSHPGFHIIAALNAAVVLWPSSSGPRTRLVQFVLRGIGFTYVLYFFLLLLPLLPFSIVAVIAFGVGFLMLTPTLLLVVQAMLLFEDARFLAAHHRRRSIALMLLGAMIVLPTGITARYLYHRSMLHGALEHVYHGDPLGPHHERINEKALRHVLDQVERNKGRSRGWGFGGVGTPFLTPWYNRVVLDNLTLSDDKLNDLRGIFLGERGTSDDRARRWAPPSGEVRLTRSEVERTFDPQQQAFRSMVHLTLHNTGGQQSEYVTSFHLPPGAWISDDYLVIEGDTVKGVLAEKKAATWVYNSIVNSRRDPSIMRYTGPDRVQLRVFPFAAGEERHAGFEVLHKEALRLVVDNDTLLLGDAPRAMPPEVAGSKDGSVVWVPANVKATLPVVRRKPEVHLIVDGSEAQRGQRQRVVERIERMITGQGLDPAAITLHVADAYTTSLKWKDGGAERFLHHAGEGGFFSDRPIRRTLIEACSGSAPTVPVIAIVPATPGEGEDLGIWLGDLHELASLLPEGPSFHVVDDAGKPHARRFDERGVDAEHQDGTLSPPSVLAWPDAVSPKAYLRMDGEAGIVVVRCISDPRRMGAPSPPRERWWADALELEGRWRMHLLRPQGGTAAWRALVRGSFQAQVMTPVTAWMCLEDDAQRNALLRKQEETLNANAALDASDEDINSMSEPGLLWLLLPALVFLVVRWRLRA